MPADAGSIYSSVRIRLDKLSADVSAVNTKFDQLGANIENKTKKSTVNAAKSFNAFAIAGTAAIGLVTLAFKKAITTFAETEQALANVKAVSGATAEEFKLLEEAASDAGTTTRFTAKEAADALFFLSSAGLSATESVAALDGVLELAGATGADLSQSAQTLTATLSQFNLEASKAADVSNVFAAANANSQATLSRLQGALRQVGSVAGALNIGLEEVVGSLQVLYNAGFEGEAAGRALKSALADLANESSVTNKKLQTLGISFEDVNPEVVGLTGAIGTLEKAGLSTAEVIDLFGKVAGPQLVTLIGAGEDALIEYEAAVTGTNEATKQYAVQNDTLAGSFDSLGSALEGTGNIFVKKYNPYIRESVDLLTDLVRLTGKAGKETEESGKKFKGFGLAILNPIALIAKFNNEIIKGVLGLSSQNRQLKKASETIGQYTGDIEDLSAVSGIAQETLDKLFEKATASLEFEAFENIGDVAGNVAKITEEFGLSTDQAIQLGLQSETLTDEYKQQLRELQDQTAQQKRQIELGYEQSAQSIIEAEIQKSLLADRLEKARIQEDEINRELRLLEIRDQERVINELVTAGVLDESEGVKQKIELREQEIALLQERAKEEGQLSQEVLEQLRAQQAAQTAYYAQLDELSEDTKDKRIDDENEYFRVRSDQIANGLAEEQAYLNRGLEIQKAAAEERKSIQEAADEEEQKAREEKIESITSYYDLAANLAQDFFSVLADLALKNAELEIAVVNEKRDADILALDERTQALLEANGLQEESNLERLQREFDEAVAKGDAETAEEKRIELERTRILEAAEKQKAAIEKEAAKKAAEIKYQGDLAAWQLNKANALVSSSQAILQGYAQLGPIGGSIAAVGTAIITGLQLALIDKNKPKAPSFATGGIVMPGTSGTEVVVAENGSSEVLFNTGAEGQAFINQMGSAIARSLGGGRPIVLNIDGEKLASYLADTFYSTASVTIDGKGIR